MREELYRLLEENRNLKISWQAKKLVPTLLNEMVTRCVFKPGYQALPHYYSVYLLVSLPSSKQMDSITISDDDCCLHEITFRFTSAAHSSFLGSSEQLQPMLLNKLSVSVSCTLSCYAIFSGPTDSPCELACHINLQKFSEIKLLWLLTALHFFY